MSVARRCGFVLAAAAFPLIATAAFAQDRSDDNAVSQAEDGFGFSVGRESIGIYNAGSARGFSPTAAGNVRIDGLYFDPAFQLPSSLIESVSIKVGLSAQGYPFAAPSGIVDQSLRRPADEAGASLIVNADQFGGLGVELDGSLPLSDNLALGYGLSGSKIEFPDGTDAWTHVQSLTARWRAGPVELVPFWSLLNDYNDEANPFIIPLGRYLPKLTGKRDYEGPEWSDYRYTGANLGLLTSVGVAKNWLLRVGTFRSVNHQKEAYTNLLVDQLPDGSGRRIVIADPPAKNISLSGEARLTHSLTEGPRLHLLHFSLRGRKARREFGGSDIVDLGPGRVGEQVDVPKPDFVFGEVSRDTIEQLTYGIAYDGRWKDVGEISFSIARADFRKETRLADADVVAVSNSAPWLYNGTAAAQLADWITAYVGYARGLEESGLAPPSAANRNSPLPVILTEQKDGGVSLKLGGGIKGVAGVFDLTRPYFGFNSENEYERVGSIRNKGLEFSIAGPLGPRVDLVAGGVLLKARVVRDADVEGVIGSRPVGLPTHILNLNLNWRTPFLEGLEFDTAVRHRGQSAATTDNLVFLPARAQMDVGTRYRFELADRNATFRLQVINLFDKLGYGVPGSGVYGRQPGRHVLGYLTVDL